MYPLKASNRESWCERFHMTQNVLKYHVTQQIQDQTQKNQEQMFWPNPYLRQSASDMLGVAFALSVCKLIKIKGKKEKKCQRDSKCMLANVRLIIILSTAVM